MPVAVIVVLAVTAAVLAVIVFGPSRRIRREGHIADDEFLALMTGEDEVASEPDEDVEEI